MTVMDMGAYAGALLAVISLLGKLVQLISAIQKLIDRIDRMQVQLQTFCQDIHRIKQEIQGHHERLLKVEYQSQLGSNRRDILET